MERLGILRTGRKKYDFYVLFLGIGGKEICLSGGIHGDEPAGVAAVMAFLQRVQSNPSLFSKYHFTIFPCNNPYGYEHNLRVNGQELDLNRQFSKTRPPAEVRMIRSILQGRRFDLSMEFHEDVDSDGYYLYEIATDPAALIGEEIIQKISHRWPVNLRAEIEGAPSRGGVINPHVSSDYFRKRIARMRQWPKAIWLYEHGTPHCITSETPVTLPMDERVEIHLTALQVALDRFK